LTINKRKKFLFVAFVLGVYLFVLQSVPPDKRIVLLIVLLVLSYILSAWALFKDLNGIEWLTVLVLPSLFPISVGLFYFLLPQSSMVRFVIIIVFIIGMYALMLTENIFSVATIRTIQLLRAARAVGFLLTILTSAFLFDVIFSLRMNPLLNAVSVFVVVFPLFMQGLWCSTLEDGISRKVFGYTVMASVLVTQMALVLSFWLVDVAMGSIFMSMTVYVLLGMYQHKLEGRLFQKTIQEYIGFGLIVFFIVSVTVLLKWSA